jgi:acyl-CoA synthetase (AMP-forming)/AMP-acid ligase II
VEALVFSGRLAPVVAATLRPLVAPPALLLQVGDAVDGGTVPGAQRYEAALDAHARGALAGYKVPKRYIAVGRIERLVSGKPDYRWARERATC